jgi:hypothetical protein
VPNFPLIDCFEGKMTMEVDRYHIEVCEDRTASFQCNDYSVTFGNDRLTYTSEKVNISCSLDEFEMTSYKCRLYANAREEVYETPKDQATHEIFKSFSPRFFAVRNDLSVIEFIRKDSPVLDDAVLKNSRIPYTFGGWSKVITAHFNDIDRMPMIFVENDGLTKEESEKILEDLENARHTQGETDPQIAEAASKAYLADMQVFARTMETFLDKSHQSFIEDNFPMEGMAEEVMVQVPPPCPDPMMQEVKYYTSEKSVFELEPGQVLNYWASHESDFAIGRPPGSDASGSRRLGQFGFGGTGFSLGMLSQFHKL